MTIFNILQVKIQQIREQLKYLESKVRMCWRTATTLHELNISRKPFFSLFRTVVQLGIPLVASQRVFVRKGMMTIQVKPKEKRKSTKHMFYLFNDLLVYGEAHKDK